MIPTPGTLVIDGAPVPKARARVVRGHSFTPARTAAAERSIRAHALARGWRPHEGPVVVTLRFFEADRRRRDLDNLCKTTLDALNGVAWRDDSQIRDLHAARSHDPHCPRTEVEVLAMPEDP